MPGDFRHAAFRREIAVKDHQSPRRLERSRERRHHTLSPRFTRSPGFLTDCAARHRHRSRMEPSRLQQSFGHQRDPAGPVEIGRHKTPPRFHVGQQRGSAADAIKVVDGECDTGLAGDGEQMQDAVR